MSIDLGVLPPYPYRGTPARRVRTAVEIGQWIATFVAAAAILGAVALLSAPRLFGWEGVIVLSGSMEPDLKVGGLAFVDPDVRPSDIRTGDVISFRGKDGQRITHRVVEVINVGSGLSFRVKGDANEDWDPDPVYAGDVIGRVRFDLPYAGYAAQKMRQRNWFVAALGIPAALLIAGELWSIGGEVKRQRRDAA